MKRDKVFHSNNQLFIEAKVLRQKLQAERRSKARNEKEDAETVFLHKEKHLTTIKK